MAPESGTTFHTSSLSVGTPIFLRLEKRGQFHEVEKASLTPLGAERAHPVLRGNKSKKSNSPGIGENEGV
jgi:hypothetical protein